MATQQNGGKVYPGTFLTPDPLIFVMIDIDRPANFPADLIPVSDDTSAQRVAAVGSDLEKIVLYLSGFGTILALCGDDYGTATILEVIMDYSSSFSEPETCQVVFDYLTDEMGYGVNQVKASTYATNYAGMTPT